MSTPTNGSIWYTIFWTMEAEPDVLYYVNYSATTTTEAVLAQTVKTMAEQRGVGRAWFVMRVNAA